MEVSQASRDEWSVCADTVAHNSGTHRARVGNYQTKGMVPLEQQRSLRRFSALLLCPMTRPTVEPLPECGSKLSRAEWQEVEQSSGGEARPVRARGTRATNPGSVPTGNPLARTSWPTRSPLLRRVVLPREQGGRRGAPAPGRGAGRGGELWGSVAVGWMAPAKSKHPQGEASVTWTSVCRTKLGSADAAPPPPTSDVSISNRRQLPLSSGLAPSSGSGACSASAESSLVSVSTSTVDGSKFVVSLSRD